MKRRTPIAALIGIAALLPLAVVYSADAQISNEFAVSITPRLYSPFAGEGVDVPRGSFIEPFSGVVDADNGVAGPFDLGFQFQFNGALVSQFYVSVNGWIAFRDPMSGGSGFTGDNPIALFDNTRPNLTLAPFFGDHYLRKSGFDNLDLANQPYAPSAIRVIKRPGGAADPAVVIVAWDELNVNFRFDPADPDNPFPLPANVRANATSVASFQLHIIQTHPTDAAQAARIEFHYGASGSTIAPGVVKSSGASVGIEDEPSVPAGPTTFINAEAYRTSGLDLTVATVSTDLTHVWPPGGFPGRVFVFQCIQCNLAAVDAHRDAVTQSIRYHPLPATREIHLEGLLEAGTAMTLYAVDGSIALRAVATGRGREVVELAGVPSGVYGLAVETPDGPSLITIVIARP